MLNIIQVLGTRRNNRNFFLRRQQVLYIDGVGRLGNALLVVEVRWEPVKEQGKLSVSILKGIKFLITIVTPTKSHQRKNLGARKIVHEEMYSDDKSRS